MSYIQDPNDKTKQIPRGLSKTVFSTAITPAENTLTKNPSYIIINTSGSFGFMYSATGSFDTVMSYASASYFTTGSVSAADSPFRLDINPIAWHRQDAAGTTGDITFVYRGQ